MSAETDRAPSLVPTTLREAQKQLTRDRLLDAAITVFSRDGYTATVDDIATAAGTSRATFYLHFKTKTDIVKELMETFLRPESDALYRTIDDLPARPTLKQLEEWVNGALGFWDRHRATVNVVRQAAALDPEAAVAMAQQLSGTADVLAERLTRRGVDPAAALTHAIVFIGQMAGLTAYSQLPDLALDPRKATELLAKLLRIILQPR